MVAFQPDPPLLAIGGGVLREPAQFLQERVVARSDVLRSLGGQGTCTDTVAPSSSAPQEAKLPGDPAAANCAATGAKCRRWWTHGPCTLRASRCSGVL